MSDDLIPARKSSLHQEDSKGTPSVIRVDVVPAEKSISNM